MTAEFNILHVDDDESVAETAAMFLEREFDRFSVTVATDPEAALEHVTTEDVDCVVSDYQMPRMDGLELFEAIAEHDASLPFILYTARGSEEIASEAISAGVTDYLQKEGGTDQYTILGNRIQNAITASRSKADLETERNRLETILGALPDVAIVYDADGTYREVLTGQTELLVDSPAELRGATLESVLPAKTATRIQRGIDAALATGTVQTIEYALDIDGTETWFEARIAPLADAAAEQVLLLARDVTERRHQTRELLQIETLFNNAQDALFLISVDDGTFTVERVNPAYEVATGLAAEDIVGQTPRELLPPSDAAAVRKKYQRCVEQRTALSYEEQLELDGEVTDWETRIAPVTIDGTVEYIAGATRNITARREQQRELELLQQAVDQAAVPITLADPAQEDLPLVYVNDAFERVTGYAEADTLGRNCRFLQGDRTDAARVAEISDAIETETACTVELLNYKKDGTAFWNRLTITPIYDDTGELIRYLGTQQDVTEQTRRERELRTLIDSLPSMGVFLFDRDCQYRLAGGAELAAVGLSPDDFRGATPHDLFPDSIADELTAQYQAALDGTEQTFEQEYNDQIYQIQTLPVTDSSDDIVSGMAVSRNVTEQRRRERAIEELHRTTRDLMRAESRQVVAEQITAAVREVLGHSETGVRLLTEDGTHLEPVAMSPAVEDRFGDRPTYRVGEGTAGQALAAQESLIYDDLSAIDDDYDRGGARAGLYVPIGEHGTITVAAERVGAFDETDITLAEILAANAAAALERVDRVTALERRNERLDEFASIISHDLRNPLNVAIGQLELVETAPDPATARIEHALSALERIETLLDDLLTYARDGRQLGDRIRTDLSETANAAWQGVTTDEATLTVETEQSVQADPTRLRQVFENLFRNSIEHGGSDVTVTVGDCDAGFYVADDGRGIPDSVRDELFTGGHAGPSGGTGLGLAIVAEIVHAHGWSIHATDSQTGGARFEITGIDQ